MQILSAEMSRPSQAGGLREKNIGDNVNLLTSVPHEDKTALEKKQITQAPPLASTLSSFDGMYSFQECPQFASLVNWSATRNSPVHRWIRYREAYSPDLIDALDLGKTILDPFCGCGSMLVGAAARGRSATGIDINPLAIFTSKVKSTPLSTSQISEVTKFLENFPSNLPEQAEEWLPDFSVAHKMFEPAILETLLRIRSSIQRANIEEPSRDFLRLCWIAILEAVGSYFKEGNGIKYRNVQRRPGKYVAREEGIWQLKRFGPDQPRFVTQTFARHLQMMIKDTIIWTKGWSNPRVIEGNALHLSDLLSSDFESIVFSPPYANRFDYFESMKVELWFGEFVTEKSEMRGLRQSSLRSHLSADLARPLERFDVLERIIGHMDPSASSWRMGVPNLLRGYFSDIVEVLRQCRKRLDKGACYIVVGNSAFAGAIVPSDTLTAEAGERAGFSQSEIWVARHLTVAPQQRAMLSGHEKFMRESIVVLRP